MSVEQTRGGVCGTSRVETLHSMFPGSVCRSRASLSRLSRRCPQNWARSDFWFIGSSLCVFVCECVCALLVISLLFILQSVMYLSQTAAAALITICQGIHYA